MAPLAIAQQTPQAAESESSDRIVVTARRREEDLQDTPVAVSAFDADTLDGLQLIGTEDLDRATPNLKFTSYGNLTGNNSAAQVFVRGIGQIDATAAVDPGVGIWRRGPVRVFPSRRMRRRARGCGRGGLAGPWRG